MDSIDDASQSPLQIGDREVHEASPVMSDDEISEKQMIDESLGDTAIQKKAVISNQSDSDSNKNSPIRVFIYKVIFLIININFYT